jgi:ABC-type nitrate/sulfonate/bicarbonate transport system permease component
MSSRAWAIIGGVGSFVRLLGWRVGFGLGVLVLWELAAGRWIDPFWFSASPWIVAALKVGVPFSLIGAIIGEFMAAARGLGYMIQLYTNQFDTTGAVSGIVVLMMCVMLFNGVLNRLERYVPRWRPRQRAAAARELQ